ncbi:rRNA maturation protein [Lasiodiplodia theobromae]|uniref:Putative nucleolar complex protein 14 n=1 Tax=Lasiodiplodia theobromae TaxID=45133 RepID=A0A5N5DIT9_9PEZI|nr:rRNA maturation protein [Lasiodiplodia theobromae]KAB2577806.1 putative nucleolar complex protein 14 [Lasiodiplodia theobromae]KAF4538447.1 rRNA maturation protein [Lasiodiplodia theobromae]
MPPSQLKRLKASLREKGIVGPQKSKKEKKRSSGKDGAERAAQRSAALASIRDNFNPFEIKAAARPEKFESTSLQKANGKNGKGVLARPGVTKSMGEETRRKTLLPELNKRNKAGGIIDRRIGENDPNMSVEDKMMERFTREKSRKKGAGLFDLEDDEEQEEVQLTHMGRALDLSGEQDDFDAGSLSGGSDDEDGRPRRLKRRRDSDEDIDLTDEEGEDEPERKKSKAEVMKEVIAKSKLHKYERQQQKEDDDDLREKLDADMHDMLSLLRGVKKPPALPIFDGTEGALGSMNPERAALMSDADKAKAEKEYDKRLFEMKLDKRAAPTTRTKTGEEKAKEEAEKLKKMEEKRMKRMRGEEDSSDEEEEQTKNDVELQGDEDVFPDDAAEFGLQDVHTNLRPPGVDDEDDFVIDDDLVASGSDIDEDDVSSGSEVESSDEEDGEPEINEEEEEDEFVRGILGKSEEEKAQEKALDAKKALETQASKLAYTYPCPQSHGELVDVLKGVSAADTPTVVQRIRALYHPQLSAENKEKMAHFCGALVDHVSFMALQKPAPPLAPIETLIRHLHSLSRTFPLDVAKAFRSHIEKMLGASTISPGDLVILTAIGTIYPTSDHFHQVVTPAITIMARWLGLTTPQTTQELVTGAYVGTLCLKYQALSKRYIPELVRFTSLALKHRSTPPDIIGAYLNNLTTMADMWANTPAFTEIFTPTALATVQSLGKPGRKAAQHLTILLSNARQRRRPQELHHWRPLPIKTSIPKFEEGFNPDKHYDPDQERREAAKLKAEYRREKKGAMRELRKDASFIAREKLREKKERDAAYEAKYKRLVAEIQGEEGREKNAYEREKKARKERRR